MKKGLCGVKVQTSSSRNALESAQLLPLLFPDKHYSMLRLLIDSAP